MGYNCDVDYSREQLLESLIKMVGKRNQHIESLNKRVHQLEWFIQEFYMHGKKQHEHKKYFVINDKPLSRYPQHASSTTRFNINE